MLLTPHYRLCLLSPPRRQCQHAHKPSIIHRDLKSPNLLVDKHWRVKVSDFNLSRIMESTSVMSSIASMNPRWLAPELLGGEPASAASDVYAFGCILWEVATWDIPWATSNPWAVVTLVQQGGRLEVPERHLLPGPGANGFAGYEAYVALMRACWHQNSYSRPAFTDIIPVLRWVAGWLGGLAGSPWRGPGGTWRAGGLARLPEECVWRGPGSVNTERLPAHAVCLPLPQGAAVQDGWKGRHAEDGGRRQLGGAACSSNLTSHDSPLHCCTPARSAADP